MSTRRPGDDSYTGETIPMHTPPNQPRRPGGQDPRYPQRSGGQNPRPPRQQVRPPNQPPRRRDVSVGRWLRRIFFLLIAGLILACVGTFMFQQRVAGKVAMADLRQNRPPANALVAPINVLLLGVDLRQDHPDEGVRSDTLILLHLDPGGSWGSMLSIPRDSIATIEGFGENKINTAFARGYENAETLYGPGADPIAAGAALAADTVEQFLGLRGVGTRINYVATINFNGFAQMIDAIGGVEVDVPREITDTEYPTEDFGYMTVHFDAGLQHMNGEQALQYVRTRHADSDFGRAERQQQVIRAIVQALRDQPLLLRPFAGMRLIDAAGDATNTTLPVGRPDALLMALMLARVDPEQITQYRIEPERVAVQEFGSDLVWDPAGVQGLVREALTPPGEAQEQAIVQVQNGAGVGGIAGSLSQDLASQGFTTATPDNAESQAASQIIDYGDHPATRRRLSETLGDMPVIEGSSADAPQGVDIVVIMGADYASYWNVP
ncbi:MAG: LCP family protein [Chloroflexi bacterium]|nr:LCP family protein [Chloroflexota bacterium]